MCILFNIQHPIENFIYDVRPTVPSPRNAFQCCCLDYCFQSLSLHGERGPYVSPGPHQVLVKNAAVAVNPIDAKLQGLGSLPTLPMKYPNILGCDIAGTVVEVGEDVKALEIGNRVIGHTIGYAIGEPKLSAFQNYTIIPNFLVTHLPDHVSFDTGVVLPCSCDTAAAGLFQKDHLDISLPSSETQSTAKTIIVWGGSSSIGCSVIQIARAAGYDVVTTASERNHALCTSLGASAVFEYRSNDVVDRILESLKGKTLAGVYDTIGDVSGFQACVAILSRSEGKKMIVTVLTPPETTLPDGIQVKRCAVQTMLGTELHVAFHAWLAKALDSGKMLPKPDPTIVGHGLDSIQPAVDMMKKGVSATKVIVTL